MAIKDRIINNLTDIQRYSFLLLSSNYSEPIKGQIHYQKELFLLAKNISDLEEEADFEADLMGPLSETANEELEQLKYAKAIEIENGKIKLTILGIEIAEIVKKETSNEIVKMVDEFKRLLNDMTLDELFGFIYFTFPEMTEESIKLEKLLPKREKIGINLYLKNKITLEKASEISGLSIQDFNAILMG